MTTNITVADLTLDRHESLLVTYHRPSRQWYASVGDLARDDQREVITADTPHAALAELLLLVAASVDNPS